MRQKMQGIIANVNKMGHPDIFLPPELVRDSTISFTGTVSTGSSRSCARVFKLGLKELMEAVMKYIWRGFGTCQDDPVTKTRIAECALNLHPRPSFEECTSKSSESRHRNPCGTAM